MFQSCSSVHGGVSLLTITDDALDLTVEENYLHLQIFPTKMH